MATEKGPLEASLPKEDEARGSAEEISGAVRDIDVAARFLATLDDDVRDTPITPEEARKVLWKIDLSILPIIWISTIVAAVDKVVISNAAIYGMKTDTHLVGNEYAWVGRYIRKCSNGPSRLADNFDAASSISDSFFLSTRPRFSSSASQWPSSSLPPYWFGPS